MKVLKILLKLFAVLIVLFLVLPYIITPPESPYKDAASALLASQASGKIVQIAGNPIYIEDLNPKSEKVITFIHGFGGSSFSWRENKQFFADRGYRVILLDLMGFGFSATDYNNDYSHPAQAQLIKEVLDYLKIPKTILTGHSMGGNIVLHFSQSYPYMVEKLIISDGGIIETNNTNPAVSIINFDPIRRWANLFFPWYFKADNYIGFLKSAYNDTSVVTDNVVNGYSLSIKIKGWQDRLIAITRDGNRNALTKPLSELNIPTLIIWGGNDPWINIEQGRSLNVKIKGSKFVEIKGAGHLPFEEQPLLFNQTVLDFIK